MESRVLEAMRTRCGCRVRIVQYAPGHRLSPHSHPRGSITLVLRGSLVERAGAAEHRASALSVVAKPPGLPHEDAFGPEGATTLQVVLPGDAEADAGAPELGGILWEHAGPACRALLGLLSLVRSGHAPREEGSEAADLVADARAALQPVPAVRGAPPDWLLAVREQLAQGSTPVGELAERAGVHRVHLARLFLGHFGVSPATYRGRMRVHRAARRLAGGPDALADVALDAGYSDQPHMNREIRAALGVTPRQLRRLAGLAAVATS